MLKYIKDWFYLIHQPKIDIKNFWINNRELYYQKIKNSIKESGLNLSPEGEEYLNEQLNDIDHLFLMRDAFLKDLSYIKKDAVSDDCINHLLTKNGSFLKDVSRVRRGRTAEECVTIIVDKIIAGIQEEVWSSKEIVSKWNFSAFSYVNEGKDPFYGAYWIGKFLRKFLERPERQLLTQYSLKNPAVYLYFLYQNRHCFSMGQQQVLRFEILQRFKGMKLETLKKFDWQNAGHKAHLEYDIYTMQSLLPLPPTADFMKLEDVQKIGKMFDREKMKVEQSILNDRKMVYMLNHIDDYPEEFRHNIYMHVAEQWGLSSQETKMDSFKQRGHLLEKMGAKIHWDGDTWAPKPWKISKVHIDELLTHKEKILAYLGSINSDYVI